MVKWELFFGYEFNSMMIECCDKKFNEYDGYNNNYYYNIYGVWGGELGCFIIIVERYFINWIDTLNYFIPCAIFPAPMNDILL